MPDGVTAAQLTLDQFVHVQIVVGQPIYDRTKYMKLMSYHYIYVCTFGLVRPNTVLFDEWLDDVVFETAQKAITECDLLLAIGSSLQVMPACNLLFDRNLQCKLVIINNTPTAFDPFAALVLRESCEQVLEDALK